MGGMGRGFLSHSQNSGGIVGHPLPTKMESPFPSLIPGHQRLLVYTRSSTSSYLYQVINVFCLYQVINVLLFMPSHQHLSFIPGASSDSLLIPGEASYSHQWLGRGGRFLGRYNADERFLGRLQEWRLGERDPRLWDGSGRRVVSSRLVSIMSKTVGGRSARLMAAASGGAASISSRVSGQAARGWGSTRPGLKPPVILSSLFGSVNDIFPLRCPTGNPEKESR